MKIRKRECLVCHHKWVSKVEYSDVTTNISGEKTEYCPRCVRKTKNVISHPMIDLKDILISQENQGTGRQFCVDCLTYNLKVKSLPGFVKGEGRCKYHWYKMVYGEKWALSLFG